MADSSNFRMFRLPFVDNNDKIVPSSKHQELGEWLESANMITVDASFSESKNTTDVKKELSDLGAIEYYVHGTDSHTLRVYYKSQRDLDEESTTDFIGAFEKPKNEIEEHFMAGFNFAQKLHDGSLPARKRNASPLEAAAEYSSKFEKKLERLEKLKSSKVRRKAK